ncbi:MAG: HAMP domain-containing histidine kinase [Mogibacterium sp.]|nr:HAMP domain-containing histidine kinase [Mogibacterium sp.]
MTEEIITEDIEIEDEEFMEEPAGSRSVAYGFSFVGFVAACTGLFFFVGRLLYLTLLQANLSNYTTVVKDAGNKYLYPNWAAVIGLAIAAVVLLVVSTKAAGRRDANGNVMLRGFDKVFTEIQVILAAFGAALAAPAAVLFWNWLGSGTWADAFLKALTANDIQAARHIANVRSMNEVHMFWDGFYELVPRHVLLAISLLLIAAGSAIVLAVIHSIARKCKAHTMKDSFLTAKVCVLLYKFLRLVVTYAWKALVIIATTAWKVIKAVVLGVCKFLRGLRDRIYDAFYKGGLTLIKLLLQIFLIIGLAAIAGVLIGRGWGPESVLAMAFVLALVAVITVPGKFRKYADVRTGIQHVRDGDFDYKIGTDGRGEFGQLATNVNEIAGANKRAIQQELRTQRLKTELISNVSHDLRTPLTSIISYVDLLKTEGLDSENAPEYLEILEQKTSRLKHLTDDLFEAAKASSGDIPVNIETIDMRQILAQASAEVGEVLEKQNIQLITTVRADRTLVKADGRLLWRVIENLLVNVGKHAMPGSRAYADIRDGGGKVTLEIKNVSAEQLNIDAMELMERFKRGDESRNTEGSGLGLAIARDLTNMMDGTFDIRIDGDLFKALVTLPAV